MNIIFKHPPICEHRRDPTVGVFFLSRNPLLSAFRVFHSTSEITQARQSEDSSVKILYIVGRTHMSVNVVNVL